MPWPKVPASTVTLPSRERRMLDWWKLAFYHCHAFKYPTRFEACCIFSDYSRGWVRALLSDNRIVETMIDISLRYPSGPIDLAVWGGEVDMVVLDGSIKRLSYS